MIQKIKNIFKNRYFQMAIKIACAVFLTVAVALSVAALSTVPKEFFPLIQSLVAFMVLGMISLVLMVVMFMIIGKNDFFSIHILEVQDKVISQILKKILNTSPTACGFDSVEENKQDTATVPDPVPDTPDPIPSTEQPPQG